ncbi:MAG: GCN5-like N-acetyltransferase [Parcubacteria group bacterium Gr01-1014_13]|nr:MAG: GCN5-like N-acetyltransferase [Parcubacteria group bacterium Gr01-1014_13]
MQLNKEIKKDSYAVKITAIEDDKEIGRVRLYVLHNDLHAEPFGLLEDVFVDENYRGSGTGTKLVQAAIEESKKIGCYKLIATVRNSKEEACSWYEKFGFKNYGVEFRLDLI